MGSALPETVQTRHGPLGLVSGWKSELKLKAALRAKWGVIKLMAIASRW
jgi:hypothetical protein